MEPITVLGAIGPIAKALEQINKLTEFIAKDKITAEDNLYYRTWLDIAAAAIHGLEGEYTEILLQAKACNMADEAQKSALLVRIDQYLNLERLRPILFGAVENLRNGQSVLQKHAGRFYLLPGTAKERTEALEEYSRLLNKLVEYLNSLGAYRGASCAALHSVTNLVDQINKSPDTVRDIVTSQLENRDKSYLSDVIADSQTVIDKLRTAFR